MTREIAIDAASLPIAFDVHVTGVICRVSTNSHTVRRTMDKLQRGDGFLPAGRFSLQALVSNGTGELRGVPHFRGLHHLVIASFGPANVFVFDIARRNIVAMISEEVADDPLFWERLLLPIAIGVMGAAVGVIPVHCACVAIDGAGLLIAGASGAGKSTLSVAMARNGFTFLSDDWTYLSGLGGQLTAHGMALPAKLLPDSVRFFPFLDAYPVRPALNEELAFELPAQDLCTQVELSCQPRWFFFLERQEEEGYRVDAVSAEDTRLYVENSVERLPPELPDVAEHRAAIVAAIPRLSCWKLTYGGPPDVAVQGLQSFLSQQLMEVPA